MREKERIDNESSVDNINPLKYAFREFQNFLAAIGYGLYDAGFWGARYDVRLLFSMGLSNENHGWVVSHVFSSCCWLPRLIACVCDHLCRSGTPHPSCRSDFLIES